MALKGETSVLVAGAGPVGLFTALSLAERGPAVQIIDKEWRGAVHSYALALHPESIRMLDRLGAAAELLEQGHRIERIAFYDGSDRAAVVDLTALEGEFPFLLVVPQSAVEAALRERLERSKVKVLWNHQVQRIQAGDGSVTTSVARMEKYSMGYPVARTEWMVTKETDVRSDFLVGADGYHSFVRKSAGARFEHHGDAQAFAVFEIHCPIDFRNEARVVFHEGTTNVVWPLDEGRARWSFEVDRESPPEPSMETLREMLRARAPWYAHEVTEIHWSTTALFERRLVDRYGQGRIWLAGDAAHITGPVGAQSMNVGFREADDLAGKLAAVLGKGGSPKELEAYDRDWMTEWRKLLGISADVQPSAGASSWARDHASKILPCVPASGDDMASLLEQIGLRTA
jgi:2-polyprenyl-6-methoxyphenol hydroxylase-like FAD-dependent oxidoreductase